MFYIYKITNLINGKFYIGKSSNPKKRFREHKNDCFSKNPKRRNDAPKLYASIRKYGLEHFNLEIIDELEIEKDAYDKETYYIELYDNVKKGLNCTSGGLGYSSGKNHPGYGKKRKPEDHYLFGGHISDDTKRRICESQPNILINENIAREIKIMLKSRISIKEICDKYNLSKRIVLNIKSERRWKWATKDIVIPNFNELNKKDIVNIKTMMKNESNNQEIMMFFPYLNITEEILNLIRSEKLYKRCAGFARSTLTNESVLMILELWGRYKHTIDSRKKFREFLLNEYNIKVSKDILNGLLAGRTFKKLYQQFHQSKKSNQ